MGPESVVEQACEMIWQGLRLPAVAEVELSDEQIEQGAKEMGVPLSLVKVALEDHKKTYVPSWEELDEKQKEVFGRTIAMNLPQLLQLMEIVMKAGRDKN